MRLPPKPDLLYVGTQLLLFVAITFEVAALRFPVSEGWAGFGWAVCAAAVCFGLAAVLQLGTTLTPWPSPKTGGRLVTTGTYGIVRHPIYFSLIAFALGLALATGSGWRLSVAVGLWLLFRRKSAYEERMLRATYPSYADYAGRVNGLLPGWTR